MNEIALKILWTLSTLLGVDNRPADSLDWKIQHDWEETAEGYMLFVAANDKITCQCKENPAAYIEFPTTIHSSSQVLLGNQIIATTCSPDFEYTKGFYSALVVPCYQISNSKESLTWKVLSYTQYFAWFQYFPKLVVHYTKTNFFGETLHIGAAVILTILCLLYLIIFTGKISKQELSTLFFCNLFTAVYFIGTTVGFAGIKVSMLLMHKIADAGVWIGFLFFIHFLYLEGLLLRWMNITYRIFILIGLSIVFIGQTGDTIQLGTTVPFLFTMVFISYAAWRFANKNRLKLRKDSFQFIGLSCFLIAYSNDVFIVTGVTNAVPTLPLGIIGSYVFILLSVNERITKTYTERDNL